MVCSGSSKRCAEVAFISIKSQQLNLSCLCQLPVISPPTGPDPACAKTHLGLCTILVLPIQDRASLALQLPLSFLKASDKT